jgi:hypothetical protein
MNAATFHRFLMLGVFVSIGTLAFAQGFYWESTTSGGMLADKTIMSSIFAMPKMFKTVSDRAIVIVRMDREKMYTMDPSKKTYYEMTFAEVEEMAKKVGGKMAELQEKMKDMPEAQRAMMEKMMGGMMKGGLKEAKLETSGEKKTISGFSCLKYIVTQGPKDTATFWVTKDVKGFESVRDDYKEFSKRMMSMSQMTNLIAAVQKIDGFTIETSLMGITSTVTKVDKRNTPATDFEVPAGYTKTAPPSLEGPAK